LAITIYILNQRVDKILELETVIMNIEEVASWLRIPPSTLSGLCRRGEIPCIKIGKHWRFDQKHVENWLDQKINKGCIPEKPTPKKMRRI
jgi:excisionase family DNA binding protein